jgi:sarcosine oxidase, subunit gamma
MPDVAMNLDVNQTISQSPLYAHAWKQAAAWPGQPQVQIQEEALLGCINLRGLPSNAILQQALQTHLQLSLPQAANTASSVGHITAYWLGPDEHLLVMPRNKTANAAKQLHDAFAGHELSVVEVSGAYTQLSLRGKDVRSLLLRGCPLDLHPRAFAAGQCAQTHLAKAPVLLHCLASDPENGSDHFKLIVRRSFAPYVATWLDDARA